MKQWYIAFNHDPQQAVTDLFSGRAGLGSSLRLDIPELLYQAFPDTPEFFKARQTLDNALLVWLQTMRRDYAAQVQRLGYGVYSKRLCDALISVQMLDLPLTTYQLRETADSWLNWLKPLRLAPERDPALEYWHVLTRRQSSDANPALWLQLARDPRHEYLNVALLGLQRLPNNQNALRNQQTQLLAVLQHAVLLPDSGQAYQFFNKHLAVLRAIYPAAPAHWQNLLSAVIESYREQSSIAKALLEKLRQPPTKSPQQKRSVAPAFTQGTNKGERLDLLKDIKSSRKPAEALAQRLFTLLDKEYTCCLATGDGFSFVRTLSEQGTILLKQHRLATASLNCLLQHIERGLSVQPMDPFIWMLWANCLASLNQSAAQQWVLREAVRLFPNGAPSRVELARLLMRLGQDTEAEIYLREAVDRSPNDEPSRVELARLLMRLGQDTEAEIYLREVVKRNPNDAPSRVVLAKLLAKQSKTADAIDLLKEFLETNPRDIKAVKLLELLESGRYDASSWMDYEADEFAQNDAYFSKSAPASKTEQQIDESNLTESEIRPVLQRTLTELQRRADLQAEFNLADKLEKLQHDAEHGDALACFYRQWLNPDETLTSPPHAWAAHACRLYQDHALDEQWTELDKTFPEKHLLTRFLQLQVTDNEQENRALLAKLDHDQQAQTPLQQFMAQALQANHPRDKNKLAFAVLASAAVDAPQLMVCH